MHLYIETSLKQGHPTDLFLNISVLMDSPAGKQEKGTDKFTFYEISDDLCEVPHILFIQFIKVFRLDIFKINIKLLMQSNYEI